MSKRAILFFCVVLITIGALVRFWGIAFGLPGTFRPDEEYLVSRALSFHTGDLNPKLFNWPTLYFYLSSAYFYTLRLLADWWGILSWDELGSYLTNTNYAPAYFFGRTLSASFGVAGIVAMYFLGKQALGSLVPQSKYIGGLFSALLLCLTFIHVRDSHFFTTDVPLAFFSTLALSAFFQIARRGSWSDYLTAALWTGLAMGTKYTALSLGFPFAVAHGMKLYSLGRKPWNRVEVLYVAVSAPLCFLIFFLTSPYILLDWETFQASTAIVRNFAQNGLVQLPTQYGWEWILFFCLPQAIGSMHLVLFLLGILLAIHFRKKESFTVVGILLSFIVPLLFVYSSVKWSPIRYMTLLTPAIAVLGAIPLCTIFSFVQKRHQTKVFVALFALVGACTLPRLLSLNETLSRTDTRIATAGWIARNLPQRVTLYSPTYFSYALPQFVDKQRVTLVKRTPPEGEYFTIIDQAPVAFSEPIPEIVQNELRQGELLFSIDPRTCSTLGGFGTTWGTYDESDALYVPLSRFSPGLAPGPRIEIYRDTPRT
ncbi:MAG: glycosyltransferase family 39 protein [Bdellovibrionales bacterium]|nr:glycosyltransferase family 39 protein [Bdellovibrionales bacterium]